MANKYWNGGAARPAVSFQLYRKVGVETAVTVGDPVVLNGTETVPWQVTFTNMPTHRQSDGLSYFYFVREVNVPENYTADKIDDLAVTNTYVIPKIDITGHKVWEGGPTPRPSIQLQLFKDNVAHLAPVTLVNGVTSHTWVNLDKTDSNGVPHVYRVDEVTTPTNYVRSISNDGLTVTNTYVPTKTNIEAFKVWAGGANRPAISFQLYRVVGIEAIEAVGSPVVLDGSEATPWKVTFANMPTHRQADGGLYTYFVREVAVPTNYTADTVDDLTVTNTFVPDSTNIVANKVWSGGANRPAVSFQLYRKVGVETAVTVGDPVVLNGTETVPWQVTFTSLPTHRQSDGGLFIYFVREVTVPENYSADKVDDLTVTNTYVIPKIDITGTKTWVGGPTPRPTIQLQLFKDNVAHLAPVTLVNGVTSYTWTNLDKTDINGVAHVYRVDEVETPTNYVRSNSQNGLIVTNTYVSPKIDITGHKVWVDGPTPRPDIELQLFRDGVEFGAPVTLVNGVLSYTWTGLR